MQVRRGPATVNGDGLTMPLFRPEAEWEGEARHSPHEPGDLPENVLLTTFRGRGMQRARVYAPQRRAAGKAMRAGTCGALRTGPIALR